MAKKNPSYEFVDQFSGEYRKLAEKVIPMIEKNLESGLSVDASVNKAFKEVKFNDAIKRSIEAKVLEAGALAYGAEIVKKSVFFEELTSINGLTISQQIADSKIIEAVKDEIRASFNARKTYLETANRLVDRKFIRNDLPKYVNDMIEATRRGIKTKADRAIINRALGNINKLALTGAPNARLRASYAEISKIAQGLSKKDLDKAVERAMKEKARYRAERIARTEIAKAQGLAHDFKASQDDDVIGVKYSLSTRHKIYDICDFHTSADLYGMGRGVYPKDLHPPYPFHPHCLCVPSDVFVGEAKKGKFKESAGSDFIKKQSAKEKQLLLGKKGVKAFNKSGKWDDNLRNYRGQENVKFDHLKESTFKD